MLLERLLHHLVERAHEIAERRVRRVLADQARHLKALCDDRFDASFEQFPELGVEFANFLLTVALQAGFNLSQLDLKLIVLILNSLFNMLHQSFLHFQAQSFNFFFCFFVQETEPSRDHFEHVLCQLLIEHEHASGDLCHIFEVALHVHLDPRQ